MVILQVYMGDAETLLCILHRAAAGTDAGDAWNCIMLYAGSGTGWNSLDARGGKGSLPILRLKQQDERLQRGHERMVYC